VPLAECIREYWKAFGLSVSTWNEGGFQVTAPDYSVVRVSLVGLGASKFEEEERLERLFQVLRHSGVQEVRELASSTEQKARERHAASGSMDKRYVNVLGGRGGRLVENDRGQMVWVGTDERLGRVVDELRRAGFDEEDRVAIVPGPLIRATARVGTVATHMPWVPSSSYKGLHLMLDEAYRAANADGPDPELDLQGLASPLWGHHSFRRGADTIARKTMQLTGATEQDIDLVFGWMEAMYSARMQIHYESRFDRDRRAAVTRMV
jgi:hypothetical protein